MKKIGGITVGGLQQRIFNLMLVFILALVGAYMAVSAYQAKNLERIVRDAETGQQASIAAISEETMHAVLQGTLKKSTALQAYIAGDLFGDVKTDVLTLQTLAEEIFAHAEGMPQHAVSGPKAENDGVASVMALHEAGAGGGDSEALGLAANMSASRRRTGICSSPATGRATTSMRTAGSGTSRCGRGPGTGRRPRRAS